MYNVSLLPYEYRVLNKQARKKDYILLSVIAIIFCLLLVYLFMSITSARKDSILNKLEAENSDIEEQIESLENIEELNNKVKNLTAKVQSAIGTTPDLAGIIVDIGNTVKPTISITNISISYSDDSGECVIKGNVFDIAAMTEWLNELENIPGINDIKYSVSDNLRSGQFIGFELTCTVLPRSANQSQEVVSQ